MFKMFYCGGKKILFVYMIVGNLRGCIEDNDKFVFLSDLLD